MIVLSVSDSNRLRRRKQGTWGRIFGICGLKWMIWLVLGYDIAEKAVSYSENSRSHPPSHTWCPRSRSWLRCDLSEKWAINMVPIDCHRLTSLFKCCSIITGMSPDDGLEIITSRRVGTKIWYKTSTEPLIPVISKVKKQTIGITHQNRQHEQTPRTPRRVWWWEWGQSGQGYTNAQWTQPNDSWTSSCWWEWGSRWRVRRLVARDSLEKTSEEGSCQSNTQRSWERQRSPVYPSSEHWRRGRGIWSGGGWMREASPRSRSRS